MEAVRGAVFGATRKTSICGVELGSLRKRAARRADYPLVLPSSLRRASLRQVGNVE